MIHKDAILKQILYHANSIRQKKLKNNRMNSVFVYCEIEDGQVAEVSMELMTKGRALATELKVKLEAIAIGYKLDGIEKDIFPMVLMFYTLPTTNAWLHIQPCHTMPS